MSFEVVDYEQMKKYENSSEILIIDVRNPDEIQNTGSIGGSINIPVDLVEEELKLPPEEFSSKYNVAKPTPQKPMVFYCRLGGRAARASESAINLGFEQVKCYKGSWEDWAKHLNEN